MQSRDAKRTDQQSEGSMPARDDARPEGLISVCAATPLKNCRPGV
jgi:hypothetical protein